MLRIEGSTLVTTHHASPSDGLTIRNKEGWQLSLSKVDRISRVEITDKWGLVNSGPVRFVSDGQTISSSLVDREVKKLHGSDKQLFGFQVYKHEDTTYVVFGQYGLPAGGRVGDFGVGLTATALGTYAILNGLPNFLGNAALGMGTSLLRYAWSTPGDDYDDKQANREGLLGGLAGIIGGVISDVVPADGRVAVAARNIGSTLVSTAAVTGASEGRLPTKGEMGVAAGSGFVGGLVHMGSSSVLNNSASSLMRRGAVGAFSGAAAGATSNTLSNMGRNAIADPEQEQKNWYDGLVFSLVSGAYTGAVYDVRGEMDRRAKLNKLLEEARANQEAEELAFKAKQEADEAAAQHKANNEAAAKKFQSSMITKEQALQGKERIVVQEQQGLYSDVEGECGRHVDKWLNTGYQPKDPSLKGNRAAIMEQLAQGEKLNFHKKGHGDHHVRFHDPSGISSRYHTARTNRMNLNGEWEQFRQEKSRGPAPVPRRAPQQRSRPSGGAANPEGVKHDLQMQAAYLDQCEAALGGKYEELQKTVAANFRSRVRGLIEEGYRLSDPLLNKNENAILEQLAQGHRLNFKKGHKGDKDYRKVPVQSRDAVTRNQGLAREREEIRKALESVARDQRVFEMTAAEVERLTQEISRGQKAYDELWGQLNDAFAEKIERLLSEGYTLTDQRLCRVGKIIEQLAHGHRLCFHHKSKRDRHLHSSYNWNNQCFRELRSQLIANHEQLAAHQQLMEELELATPASRAPIPDFTDLTLEGREKQFAYTEQVIKTERRNLRAEVEEGLGSRVNDLLRRGFHLKDQNLKGDISAILDQLARGKMLTFKKDGKSRAVESTHAQEVNASIRKTEKILAADREHLAWDLNSYQSARASDIKRMHETLEKRIAERTRRIDEAVSEAVSLQAKGNKTSEKHLNGNPEAMRAHLEAGNYIEFKGNRCVSVHYACRYDAEKIEEIPELQRRITNAELAFAADFGMEGNT